MQTIKVKVQDDFLERMSTAKPYVAVAELIWNALDAEASKVEVFLEENDLGGVVKITIRDDGHGISFEDAVTAFENLGGSWKKNSFQSKTGYRRLHGKKGQGRFLAFSLGESVVWETRSQGDASVAEFEVSGSLSSIGEFKIGDTKPAKNSRIGTTVTISEITNPLGSLTTNETRNALTEIFPLYLRQYPDINIIFNGIRLDPSDVQERIDDRELPPVTISDGSVVKSNLTTIEWKIPIERNLNLCDANGFSLAEVKPGIQAPGFNFTSYLKSQFFGTSTRRVVL